MTQPSRLPTLSTLLLTLAVFSVLLVATQAVAATPRPLPVFSVTVTTHAPTSGFTYNKLVKIANELIKILLYVAELAAVGAVVYYGLRMVMSKGDPGQFKTAKNGLGIAILGALVIFGVYTIIATVQGGVESIGN